MMLPLKPSIEVTGDDLRREGSCLARLPGVWEVFVAHLDGQTPEDFLQDCLRVRRLGHRPVPHLAARRYRSLRQLEATIQHLHGDADVREALVLAGDAEPEGALEDSLGVMDSGLLEQSGLKRIWFAGYPEGHPHIDESCLEEALKRKTDWSRFRRMPIGIVTQLTKDLEVSAAWCEKKDFAARGIAVRISRFLSARTSVLLDLARLAGMPQILRTARESQESEYVRSAWAHKEEERATPLRAAHYMALGALERMVGELLET